MDDEESELQLDTGNVGTGPSKIEATYHEFAALLGETAGPDDDASISEATERMTDSVPARPDVGCGNGRPAETPPGPVERS
jgi:hypothetical protein